LILVGFGFLRESAARLVRPPLLNITPVFIIVVFITAVVKLILAAVTRNVAARIDSVLLHADASHHYSDFFTSLAISAGLLFVRKGFTHVDAGLGIFVSLVILFWAFRLLKGFIDNLIGKEVSPDNYRKIKNIVLSFPRVEGVHDINIHAYGHNNMISLHIVVEKSLSLGEAHSLADSIEKRIYREGLGRCVIHVDPGNPLFPRKKSDVEKAIVSLVRSDPRLKDYHGLEVIATEDKNILNFHLILDKTISLPESHAINHRVADFFREKFGFSQVNIHIEPYTESRE
jgi:divalent metal cation (Fe/Co/Zn/Cd) transporter